MQLKKINLAFTTKWVHDVEITGMFYCWVQKPLGYGLVSYRFQGARTLDSCGSYSTAVKNVISGLAF